MTDVAQMRLIAIAVVVGILTAWVLARRSARQRQERFATLARSLGAQAQVQDEFLSSFCVNVDGRAFEVRHQHIGGGRSGSGWTPDWYLVTTTLLNGVPEVHSADIRPRLSRNSASPPTADDFVVRDFGYALRNGWLSPATAQSIAAFYETDLPLDRITIEEGKLTHRSRFVLRRLNGPRLHELLSRQAALATQLERSL